MDPSILLVTRPAEGVALLTLNRPRARNAINLPLLKEIEAALRVLEADESVRALVFTGAGAGFSAGYDIFEMQHYTRAEVLAANIRRESWIWHIANFPKAIVGAINGAAHGAGAIIATAFDIRIGTARTEFRYTATPHGGAYNTWQLPPLVGWARAKEFLYTARPVSGAEALDCGLLNHLVAEDLLLKTALDMAAQIASYPPDGIRWTKQLIHDNWSRAYQDAYNAENRVMRGPLAPRAPAELFKDFVAARPARRDGT